MQNPRHIDLSLCATQSLKEIKNLRIILASLFNHVTPALKSENDDNTGESKVEPQSFLGFRMHKIINKFYDSIHILEELSKKMYNLKHSSPNFVPIESNVVSYLSFLNMLKQMEISVENNSTRTDSIIERPEAIKWLHRTREANKSYLEGLLVFLLMKRNNLEGENSLVSCQDLESDLNDWVRLFPELLISIIDPKSPSPIIYVKVGEVMHCLITFRHLNAEHIIIRGLDESMCVRSLASKIGPISANNISGGLNASIFEMGKSSGDSLLIPSYELNSDTPKRPINPHRVHQVTKISRSQIDLFTESRHCIFQRITMFARCAIVKLASESHVPFRLKNLLEWLVGYKNLFTVPCLRCNNLVAPCGPPSYFQLPIIRNHNEGKFTGAMHEHCLSSSNQYFASQTYPFPPPAKIFEK